LNNAPKVTDIPLEEKAIKRKRKQKITTSEITDKTKALMAKLQILEDQLNDVKENIPVAVNSLEEKLLVIKGSLEGALKQRFYKTSDLKKKLEELGKLEKDIDELESDLGTRLYKYLVFVNCEFSSKVGKVKDLGLKVKSTVNSNFQKGMPLDETIAAVKQILEGGRVLAQDLVQIAEPIYGIIRPLYEPGLPEKSKAIEYTLQRLEQKESPWIAIEVLGSSLYNWNRQYSADILDSVKYLKNSLKPIADLSVESEVLPLVFGENMLKVLDCAKKADEMKLIVEKMADKEQLTIVDIVALKDDIQSFLTIAKDIISLLYAKLVTDEDLIGRLLPTKDYLWEDYLWDKNGNLCERLKKATEALSNPSNYKVNNIMENLPIYVSYVDEAVQALAVNNERKEFLLNYPNAEVAIEEQLKQGKRVSPRDLPFEPKFASEYLRLYYSQRFSEFAFDRVNMQLTKKT
jgi:hypothetical protein